MKVATIVVGVDGSDNAARAIAWTAGLAAQLGASVVAVHAYRPLDHLTDMEPPIDFEAIKEDVRGRLRDNWCGPFAAAGVDFRCEVMHGEAAAVLRDAADAAGADLIVVGARGLGTLRSLVLGSVSQKLVNTSSVPVTIIPPERSV